MPETPALDYYELLQISPNADLDTIHRVYRLLAQRLHPDNQATGDSERFRALTEAYHVVGDPERRAQYDVHRPERQQERSRLISEALRAQNDVESEQLLRLTLLELLYARRRTDPRTPGVYYGDLESLLGRPREHLEFALWYLARGSTSIVVTALRSPLLPRVLITWKRIPPSVTAYPINRCRVVAAGSAV